MTHNVSLSCVITPEMIAMLKSIMRSNMISNLDPEMLNSPTINDSINTILDQKMAIVMPFFGLNIYRFKTLNVLSSNS